MNLRKHVAGFVIFSTIVGSAIFINAYLTALTVAVPHVQISETIPQVPTVELPQPISYKVRMVSLDFINKKSYTELKLERQTGQPMPESVWVTTFFFAPQYPGRVWMSKAEIRLPFVHGDQVETVATDSNDLFTFANAPRDGYFAHVYVSTKYTDNSYPEDFRDITKVVPVVVQWPDERGKPANTSQELTY